MDYIDKIICGDSLKIMKNMPDNFVDVAFIDPPFNLKKGYNEYKDEKSDFDYLDWSKDWILEMIRIIKPTGSVFIHNIPKWLLEYYRILFNYKDQSNEKDPYYEHVKNLKLIDWIVWNEPGTPKGRYLYASHYGILWLAKSSKVKYHNMRIPHKFCRVCDSLIKDYGGKKDQINEFGTILSDVWDDIHRYKHSKRRDAHPNQLPVPLLERLLLMTADNGDLVLDPMCGVGTTCIAAKRMGMHYLGIDIDQSYCNITESKLLETDETKINDVNVSIFMDKVLSIRNRDVPVVVKSLKHIPIKYNRDKYRQISTAKLAKEKEGDIFEIFDASLQTRK